MTEGPPPAVLIRDAYKRYSPSAVILKGLNMRVPSGSIYGLLGPSGCGKTSLLSCIVGLRTFDSGTISVDANNKIDIGYMPQDICLNTEFTPNEVFNFFGRIYGMSKAKIKERSDELMTFLQIPKEDRYIGTYSGGQQRRISMAVTLLHDPKILILDEPTVGVDPLLSHSIWEHFIYLVNERSKTIIITTHYIEEARSANTIGLMREGILLAEEPPSILLERFHCETLEEVFLMLSAKQEDGAGAAPSAPYPPLNPNVPPLVQNGFQTERFQAQLIKNINWTKRNFPVTSIVICLPAVLMYLLSNLADSSGSDFPLPTKPLGFVNDDADCNNISASVKLPYCPTMRPISCRYLDKAAELFMLNEYETVDEAVSAVHRGKTFGVIQFLQNYSSYVHKRLSDQTSASAKAINDSTIQTWLDMSEYVYTVRTVRELTYTMLHTLQDVAFDCGYERKIADIPIEVQEEMFKVPSVLQSYTAQFLSSVSFYTTTMYTSSAIVMERASGLIERSRVAGLTMNEIAAAHVIVQIGVMCVQNALSFTMLYGIQDFTQRGSIVTLLVNLNFIELAGMMYGFFLAVVIQVEKNVVFAGITTVLTLFMMTGTIWPVEGMHWVMKPFTNFIPVSFSAKGYFNVSVRGWDLSYFSVYFGTFIVPIVTIIFMGLASYLAIYFKVGSFD